MKVRIRLLLIMLVLSSLILSGCWDRRELNELALVMGVGVDVCPEEEEIDLTVQVIKTEAMPTPAGNGGSGGDEKQFWNVKRSGKNVFAVIRDFTHEVSRKLYFSHNQIIILGDELLEESGEKYLDFFVRDHESRLSVLVFAAEGKASDVLDVEPEITKIPAFDIASLAQMQANTSQTVSIRLIDFVNSMASDSKEPVLPILKIKNSDEGEIVEISGTAIFKDNKKVGELDELETRGFKWAANKIDGGVLDVRTDGGYVEVEIKSSDTKAMPKINDDGKITIKIEIELEGIIGCVQDDIDLESLEVIDKVEKDTEEFIKREIENTFDITKRYGADIYGFGELVEKYKYKQWHNYKDDWIQHFKEIELEIKADVAILEPGGLVKSQFAKQGEK